MSRRLSEELAAADFADARLTKRLCTVVDAMAEAPEESFPQRMRDEASLEASYRFMSNERVSHEAILEPHIVATVQRVVAAGQVVVAHDTSSFRFEGEARQGLGRLLQKGRGFFGHVALAVTAEGRRDPLGVLGFKPLIRGDERIKANWKERRLQPDNESRRWGDLVEEVDERLGRGRAVHVMDREADSYDLFARLVGGNHRFVTRMTHDRRIELQGESAKLMATLDRAVAVAVRGVHLSSRKTHSAPAERKIHPPRRERLAKLAFSAMPMTLRNPTRDGPSSLKLHVVRVWEIDTPDGCEPVEWRLVTAEPIETPEQILAVVDFYRLRWLIEEFFKALKSGCAVEKRQLESLHALLNATAMCMPIAWNLLRLRTTAQDHAETPAEQILTPTQLRVLESNPRTMLPSAATVEQALLAVAALGGHLKRNGAPGWQTLGRGYDRLLLLEEGWNLNATTYRSDQS